MRVRVASAASLLVLIACSGASDLLGGGSDGGDAGSTGDATVSGDDSSSDDSSSEATSSSGGGSSTLVGSSGGADAPWDEPCPDITGDYAQLAWTGQGCGTITTSTSECIVVTPAACVFQLGSPAADTAVVNGIVLLQGDGTFSGAALLFGTTPRVGCTGQWDDASQTLTVACGVTGSGQSCTVTLTRTGSC